MGMTGWERTGWWKAVGGGRLVRRAGSVGLTVVVVVVVAFVPLEVFAGSPDGGIASVGLYDELLEDGLRLVVWCVYRGFRRVMGSPADTLEETA